MREHPAYRILIRTAGYFVRGITLLLAVSIVAFFLVKISPVDPVQQYTIGVAGVTEEQRQAIAERFGVGEPAIPQYFNWLGGAVRGDFGTSAIYLRPVLSLLGERFLNTLALMLVAWVLSAIIGFGLGMIMGVWHGKWPDQILRRVCLVLCSAPTYWLGMILLLFFAVMLGWFPIGLSSPIGVASTDVTLWQRIHHLILPALTLSFIQFANIALHTRQKMVDAMESDYVLFAKARGQSTRFIVFRHAVRNVALPAITLQFASFSELFSGAVLAETVFTYPGLGSMVAEAGLKGDVPLLLGITVFSAAFVFVGNLTANLIYGIVDPRIREGASGG